MIGKIVWPFASLEQAVADSTRWVVKRSDHIKSNHFAIITALTDYLGTYLVCPDAEHSLLSEYTCKIYTNVVPIFYIGVMLHAIGSFYQKRQ